MPSAIELPLRESTSPRRENYTADVAVSWPAFGYWFKAGIALALGFSVVYVAGMIVWVWLVAHDGELGALRMLRII